MPLILAGATSGQATIQATDAATVTMTLPATSGTLVVTGGAQTIEFADGSAAAPSITNSGDTNTGIFFPAADTIAFTEGGVESVRITDAGNVGIGTSSPAAKTEISGTAAASNLALRITNTATDGYSTLQLGGAGDGGVFRNGSTQTLYGGASSLNLITVGAHPIGFATGNTLRAIIDSSGNVGIGVTTPTHKLAIGYSNSDASNKIAVGNIGAYQGLLDYNNGNEIFTIENTTDYSIGGINFKVNGADRGFFDINGNFRFNSGYGSVATAYGCRAWVNFDGTGTPAIRASGNVSSITDNGTGDYTVNFTTAMPDANYAVSGTNAFSGANASLYAIKPYTSGSFAVGSIRINSVYASGGTTDVWDTNTLTVAIFR
jgi:hypothetical protein